MTGFKARAVLGMAAVSVALVLGAGTARADDDPDPSTEICTAS